MSLTKPSAKPSAKQSTKPGTLSGQVLRQVTGQDSEHIHWLSANLGIHQQMLAAWQAMRDAAALDGFDLAIASGFRDFSRQLMLWNNKYTGVSQIKDLNNDQVSLDPLSEAQRIHAILLFSALPGASRHHWGTDIDVYAPNLLAPGQSLQLEPWEYQGSGPFAGLSAWLQQHSCQFGFYFPYDKYRQGVAAEPWHLSYAPLALQYQRLLSLEVIQTCIEHSNILGKQVIIDNLSDIYQQYVINISQPAPALQQQVPRESSINNKGAITHG